MTSGANREHDELDPGLELRLRLDAQSGPATRIGKDRARDLVLAAMTAETAMPAGNPEKSDEVSASRASRFERSRMGLAAAALLVAFISGASASLWVWGRREIPPSPTVQPAARGSEPLKSATAPAPVPEADALGTDNVVERATPRPKRTEVISEDLLERANRLRAEGSFAEARDTYAQVVRRSPNTLSAYAAQVAAGSLELEHLGRPEEARRLFERALAARPTGALSLEIYQGLAASYAALGRTHDELRTLKRLISTYPSAHAAKRAGSRIEELESSH